MGKLRSVQLVARRSFSAHNDGWITTVRSHIQQTTHLSKKTPSLSKWPVEESPAKNASLFECFPYVCPEPPVLVNSSFLVQSGAEDIYNAFFAPAGLGVFRSQPRFASHTPTGTEAERFPLPLRDKQEKAPTQDDSCIRPEQRRRRRAQTRSEPNLQTSSRNGHLYIKTNILPRQARDKHRESSTQNRHGHVSESILAWSVE